MDPKETKIGIETSYSDTDEIDVEFPWAVDLGNNQYQLKNFPFYAYGVSYDDIVEAHTKYEDDPYPYMTKIIKKSGHRTLRIILDESIKGSEHSREIIDTLASMNCGYEGANGEVYFVINIQPHCDFDAVREYLNEQNVQWEYADPTYDEIHKNDN